MKAFIIHLWALALTLSLPLHAETKVGDETDWEASIVTLDVTSKRYDFFQPWSRSVKQVTKNGVVIAPDRILTTADGLEDNIMVRVQKRGRGAWWEGAIDWVDYHSNLAMIRCDQTPFWSDLKPVKLSESLSETDSYFIARWTNGRFEKRRTDFDRFSVQGAELMPVNHIQMILTSEIDGAGWAEPVIQDGVIAGLTSAHQNNKSIVIPAPFIRSILEAKSEGTYSGLGYFSFIWQPSSNPATLDFLDLEGPQRGALVIEVPTLPGRSPVLKRRDIILEVDGFKIDIQGDYLDPDYGYLMLENLSTRGKWAGDQVHLKVWRQGEIVDVTYEIPSIDLSWNQVGNRKYDEVPEFLIAGGLLFQPLTQDLLRNWPRRAPFRLSYYQNEPATEERKAILMLTQILPDPYSLGYEGNRFLPLESVNHQKTTSIEELIKALQEPTDGFHILKFMPGASPGTLVLDAGQMQSATERILQRYGIPAASHQAMTR